MEITYLSLGFKRIYHARTRLYDYLCHKVFNKIFIAYRVAGYDLHMVTTDDGWKEADITVNGVKLSTAQAMTVRVALNSFAMDMNSPFFQQDKNGKALAKCYLRCVSDVNAMLMLEAT